MSWKQKLLEELESLVVAAVYFGCWITALITLKHLVLAEYKIDTYGYSMALIGTLILAKVVLILEHVSLGAWVRSRPAWVDVILRTAMYSAGVVVVLVLERGIEGRHEHGGFVGAVKAAFQGEDADHILANAMCISGALLVYNALSVVRRYLGDTPLFKLFLVPLPAPPEDSQAPAQTE